MGHTRHFTNVNAAFEDLIKLPLASVIAAHSFPEVDYAKSSKRPSGIATISASDALTSEIERRAKRDRIFGNQLFSDPAWDILIDLMLADLTGKQISISSACIASKAPATTALRYIALLEKELLIEKRNDPSDGRRTFIFLSHRGKTLMKDYLEQCSLV